MLIKTVDTGPFPLSIFDSITIPLAWPENEAFKSKVSGLIKSAYNKDVQIIEEKDKSLIGGFVLTVGDKQIDASISSKLAELEKEFNTNTYVKDY